MNNIRSYLEVRSYIQSIFLTHDSAPNLTDLEEVVDSSLSESDLEVSEVSISEVMPGN